jgi:phosphoribosylformylglycinamidine cyclo-ligase
MGLGVDDLFPDERASVADVLLRVHRSYLHAVAPLLEVGAVRGMAHITGGGLVDNLPRILPSGTSARIEQSSWEVPPVFRVLQRGGGVAESEMFRAFNMGVGMVLAVPAPEADSLVARLTSAGERSWIVGEIIAGEQEVILS